MSFPGSIIDPIGASIARALCNQRADPQNLLEIEMLGMSEHIGLGKVVQLNLLDLPSEILIVMMKAGNLDMRDAVAMKRTAKRLHTLMNAEKALWKSIYQRMTGFDSSTRCQDRINQWFFNSEALPLLYLSRECDPQDPFTAQEHSTHALYGIVRLGIFVSPLVGFRTSYNIAIYTNQNGKHLELESMQLRCYEPRFVICDGAIVVRDADSGTIHIYNHTLKYQGTLPSESFPEGMCSSGGKLLVKYTSGKLIEYTFMPEHDSVLNQIAQFLSSDSPDKQKEARQLFSRMPDQIKNAILQRMDTWKGLKPLALFNRNNLAVAIRTYLREKKSS